MQQSWKNTEFQKSIIRKHISGLNSLMLSEYAYFLVLPSWQSELNNFSFIVGLLYKKSVG